ncbi:MAG: hypothetical protein JKY95_14605 [Planctomycetaceae bacterium]|nr:hypothetical protein [Planctomycetaceae bacterium]
MRKLFVMTALMLAVSAPVMAKNYIVKMISDADNTRYYFEPAALTIKAGDTVKWVNAQEDFHNAAATSIPKGAEFFEGPMLEEKGQSWSYKFTKSGTYEYECQPHAMLGMVGMIVVDYTSAPEDIETKAEE